LREDGYADVDVFGVSDCADAEAGEADSGGVGLRGRSAISSGKDNAPSIEFMVIWVATYRRCAVKHEDEIAYLPSFQAEQ
jgi:hypothetical protein